MLQKVQYDVAGKLSVRSSSTVLFSNYKITPSSSKGENKINKVIILDTKKIEKYTKCREIRTRSCLMGQGDPRALRKDQICYY